MDTDTRIKTLESRIEYLELVLQRTRVMVDFAPPRLAKIIRKILER